MAMALFGPWPDSSMHLVGVVPFIIFSSATVSAVGQHRTVIIIHIISSGGGLRHQVVALVGATQYSRNRHAHKCCAVCYEEGPDCRQFCQGYAWAWRPQISTLGLLSLTTMPVEILLAQWQRRWGEPAQFCHSCEWMMTVLVLFCVNR